MAVPCNKYSSCYIYRLALSCIKTNLRENRIFATEWAVGEQKGTHSVKILAEMRTKPLLPTFSFSILWRYQMVKLYLQYAYRLFRKGIDEWVSKP